jgi:DNA repair exonuclease SbcCD ATPase subunit
MNFLLRLSLSTVVALTSTATVAAQDEPDGSLDTTAFNRDRFSIASLAK